MLESIRDSLNEQLVIPEWLVDIFLGYGDAGAAHYTQMPGLLKTVDFKVTHSSKQHACVGVCFARVADPAVSAEPALGTLLLHV